MSIARALDSSMRIFASLKPMLLASDCEAKLSMSMAAYAVRAPLSFAPRMEASVRSLPIPCFL